MSRKIKKEMIPKGWYVLQPRVKVQKGDMFLSPLIGWTPSQNYPGSQAPDYVYIRRKPKAPRKSPRKSAKRKARK